MKPGQESVTEWQARAVIAAIRRRAADRWHVGCECHATALNLPVASARNMLNDLLGGDHCCVHPGTGLCMCDCHDWDCPCGDDT